MNWRIVGIVYGKELLDLVRDRRTILVTLLLPICLYPLTAILTTQWIGSEQLTEKQRVVQVGLRGGSWNELEQHLAKSNGIDLAVHAGEFADHLSVADGNLDAELIIPDDVSSLLNTQRTVRIALRYDETRSSSQLAYTRLKRALDEFSQSVIQNRLVQKGLARAYIEPVRLETASIANKEQRARHLLSRSLALIILMMVLLGAFYPAIDLTAGEKERGTLETLLVTPASRVSLILGKSLVAATVSFASGLVNLSSLGLTILLGFGPAFKHAGMTPTIPFDVVLLAVIALLPAALFFSATLVALASLARSFKEAQSLITPFFLVLLLPAMLAQLSEIHLTPLTAWIPSLNISLLVRDLIKGDLSIVPFALTLFSTLIYAIIALSLAARIYNSETLLFSEERWSLLKKTSSKTAPSLNFETDRAPTPREAISVLGIVMALLILFGQPLQANSLVSGLLITEWILIAGPALLLIRLGRYSSQDVFAFNRVSPRCLLGAFLAGTSAWFVVGILVQAIQQRIFPLPKELIDQARQLFSPDRPLVLDLFVIAISPAICEEILFRGVLLRATRNVLTPTQTILVNGVLFGLFHLSIYRFFPTATLGCILAFIVLRTGSIFPAMFFHFLNNSAALILGRFAPETVTEQEPTLTTAHWLMASFAFSMFLVGMKLVFEGSASAKQRRH